MPDGRYANRGQSAEELIVRACEAYRRRGEALITKVPTPVTVLRTREAFFRAPAVADFVGVVRGGQSVALEVKSTRNRSRFPLGQVVSRLHQCRYLADHLALGGIGGYLLVWWDHIEPRCVFVLPSTIAGWLAAERASVPLEMLVRQFGACPFSGALGGFDFLPVVLGRRAMS